MKLIKAIFQTHRIDEVTAALATIDGLGGAMLTETPCVDAHHGYDRPHRHAHLEVVVPDPLVERVVGAIHRAAHTGRAGDGGILVIPIETFVSIREEPQ